MQPIRPLGAATPATERHARRAELVSRAWTEALALAGPHPAPHPGRDTGTPPTHAPRPPGELVAAALRAHSTLMAGLGRNIPVTGLEPGARGMHGVRGLATFLAVYAGHHRQDARDLGTAA